MHWEAHALVPLVLGLRFFSILLNFLLTLVHLSEVPFNSMLKTQCPFVLGISLLFEVVF